MSENNQYPIHEMEDITSASEEFKAKKDPVGTYGNALYKNLGNVIKSIAFILSFGVILIGFLAAFLLFTKTTMSVILTFAIIIFFTLIAASVFFPIYGIGHIVCQNNEILEKLEK